jgi:hypothetical protein
MKKVSICLLALLLISLIEASSIDLRLRRRMQKVVNPAPVNTPKTDIGKSPNDDKKKTSNSPKAVNPAPKDQGNGKSGYTMTIAGNAWSLSWEKWIWGIVFIVCGIPLNWLGLPWWKLLRLPVGALVGFFLCNYFEVYVVRPYVEYTETLK